MDEIKNLTQNRSNRLAKNCFRLKSFYCCYRISSSLSSTSSLSTISVTLFFFWFAFQSIALIDQTKTSASFDVSIHSTILYDHPVASVTRQTTNNTAINSEAKHSILKRDLLSKSNRSLWERKVSKFGKINGGKQKFRSNIDRRRSMKFINFTQILLNRRKKNLDRTFQLDQITTENSRISFHNRIDPRRSRSNPNRISFVGGKSTSKISTVPRTSKSFVTNINRQRKPSSATTLEPSSLGTESTTILPSTNQNQINSTNKNNLTDRDHSTSSIIRKEEQFFTSSPTTTIIVTTEMELETEPETDLNDSTMTMESVQTRKPKDFTIRKLSTRKFSQSNNPSSNPLTTTTTSSSLAQCKVSIEKICPNQSHSSSSSSSSSPSFSSKRFQCFGSGIIVCHKGLGSKCFLIEKRLYPKNRSPSFEHLRESSELSSHKNFYCNRPLFTTNCSGIIECFTRRESRQRTFMDQNDQPSTTSTTTITEEDDDDDDNNRDDGNDVDINDDDNDDERRWDNENNFIQDQNDRNDQMVTKTISNIPEGAINKKNRNVSKDFESIDFNNHHQQNDDDDSLRRDGNVFDQQDETILTRNDYHQKLSRIRIGLISALIGFGSLIFVVVATIAFISYVTILFRKKLDCLIFNFIENFFFSV
ncbi:hypothetical protein SSS_04719 [Sarcoptes scabiei]|uniref:Uncharacterized protein n=1 Tax=Sarcoptes scabiei TaxID=52283 RepID=A0A834R642_SARSC|nr:hypothetical protein SSS_04719 [Sarcoptes scabiei]